MKKIINNFTPNKNFLKENFLPTERNSVSLIYEKLFYEIIKSYTSKKNYQELPFYLNYLILKSNAKIEKFFIKKAKEIEGINRIINQNDSNSEFEYVKYICRNLDKMFEKYTNYGSDMLNKLQLIQFFHIQPVQAKIMSDYQPVLENFEKFDLVRVDDRSNREDIIQNFKVDNYSFKNPFLSRLNTGGDIHPKKHTKTEFIKSNIKLNKFRKK